MQRLPDKPLQYVYISFPAKPGESRREHGERATYLSPPTRLRREARFGEAAKLGIS